MEEKKSKEIDVLALVLAVLRDWKTLAIFASTAALIVIIVAFSTPRTYTAQVMLAPELSSGGIGLSSNMSDLASTFGINMNKNS